jgi:hypothetical protein
VIADALGRDLDRLRDAYGDEVFERWLEVVEARVHSPEVSRIALEWRNVARATIPPEYRNMAFLVTSIEAGALRTYHDHVADSINDGMRPEAASALLEGLDHLLTPDELEIAAYVRAFIHRRIGDAQFASMLERLGPSLLVSFNYLIGMTLNGILCQVAVGLEQESTAEAREQLATVTEVHLSGGDLSPWLATAPTEYSGGR